MNADHKTSRNTTRNTTYGLKERAIDWLFQQGVSTILLIVILLLLAYLSRYALKEAIPQHLKAMQSGYERQEAAHDAQLSKVIESFEKQQRTTHDLLREIRGQRIAAGQGT